MKRQGLLATLALAAVLLAGCTARTFVDDAPDTSTPIPDELTVEYALEPESVRYQGSSGGIEVYLARGDGRTHLVLVDDDDLSKSLSASTTGPGFVGAERRGIEFRYVPEGTDPTPEGWTALSDWVLTR